MAKLKVDGLKELQKALKDKVTLDDVKRVVSHNGQQLQTTSYYLQKNYVMFALQ